MLAIQLQCHTQLLFHQIGNLNGYYHFRLTERFNISRLGDVSLAATGQLLNISGLESLGSASQTLPTFFHRLTHALSKDQSVSSYSLCVVYHSKTKSMHAPVQLD